MMPCNAEIESKLLAIEKALLSIAQGARISATAAAGQKPDCADFELQALRAYESLLQLKSLLLSSKY